MSGYAVKAKVCWVGGEWVSFPKICPGICSVQSLIKMAKSKRKRFYETEAVFSLFSMKLCTSHTGSQVASNIKYKYHRLCFSFLCVFTNCACTDRWCIVSLSVCSLSHKFLLTLLIFAHSEDRPAPNNQKGAIADQDQNRLTARKAGKDWEATSLRCR